MALIFLARLGHHPITPIQQGRGGLRRRVDLDRQVRVVQRERDEHTELVRLHPGGQLALQTPIYLVRCSLRTRVLPHASFRHPIYS